MTRQGGRALGGGVLGLLVLALAGCGLYAPRQSEPELILSYAPGALTITARVVGISGDLYIWDWGDGVTQEGTVSSATHTYDRTSLYTVRVTVAKLGTVGSGAPGPGTVPGRVVLAELSAVADLRPSLELTGIAITVLSPPSWYDPNTWPEDAFPAGCSLEVMPVLARHRADAAEPTRAVWTVFREGRFHLQVTGLPAVIPYDALYTAGCGANYAYYQIQVSLFMSDGSILSGSRTIRVCSPQGCW